MKRLLRSFLMFIVVSCFLLEHVIEAFSSRPYFEARVMSQHTHLLRQPQSNIRRESLMMASRQNFDAPQKFNPINTDVRIDAPSINSRRITASIIINAPVENVWAILTDYNNLATHVPNLIQSYLVPDNAGRVLLFQEGAQKIVGFNFRASLTMEMMERKLNNMQQQQQEQAKASRQLDFSCVESAMFKAFDGSWNVQFHSRVREFDKNLKHYVLKDKSKLTYSVMVKPRGPVPVFALEWRIKEDVPVNLWAVKMASERLPQNLIEATSGDEYSADEVGSVNMGASMMNKSNGWEVDETLSSYMGKGQRVIKSQTVSGITPTNREQWQPKYGRS